MSNEEEDLFSQLASDTDIAAAVAEHEAACALKAQSLPCPICLFFSHIHELAHLAEALDAEKIVNLTPDPHLFLDDSMVIIQFLTEATRYFLADQVAWYEEDEEGDEEEDEL